jgi:2-amino-4-hydroxy-6-hydroxymethyldihydropteridine diphosphokinase
MPLVYLALGANLGDRSANLQQALQALAQEIQIKAVSPVYETEPAYVLDQPRFYNLAIQGETTLSPLHTLAFLKQLEAELGRAPSIRFGPRLIDLDLLFYDQVLLDSPELIIPHPRLQERAFVLVPLNDLAHEFVHPRLGLTIGQLLEQLPAEEKRKVWPAQVALTLPEQP